MQTVDSGVKTVVDKILRVTIVSLPKCLSSRRAC
jgi:hypothetical protein